MKCSNAVRLPSARSASKLKPRGKIRSPNPPLLYLDQYVLRSRFGTCFTSPVQYKCGPSLEYWYSGVLQYLPFSSPSIEIESQCWHSGMLFILLHLLHGRLQHNTAYVNQHSLISTHQSAISNQLQAPSSKLVLLPVRERERESLGTRIRTTIQKHEVSSLFACSSSPVLQYFSITRYRRV